MTKPKDPALLRPTPRARRSAKASQSGTMESRTPDDVSRMGTDDDRKGGRKSEAVVPETGAGATFSESHIKAGGSGEEGDPASLRGQREGADGVEDSQGVSERVRLLPLEGPVLGRVVAPGGWREVISREDPGTGFYRFVAGEVPSAARGLVGNGGSIEVFATDLAHARRMLALMSRGPRRALGGGVAEAPPSPEAWPFAFRPTRLCKRARAGRGEA